MTESHHIVWQDVYQVEHGWINELEWRQRIIEHYPSTHNLVDLNKLVVSADTEKRILRYVFPKKGVIFAKIEHADIPGAFNAMTDCFIKCKLNILSASLTRGGAKPHNAILNAICEPEQEQNYEQLKSKLEDYLTHLDPKYRIRKIIHQGENAAQTIYPRHPDEYVARVPNTIRPVVQEYQKQLPHGKIPIFISRRFIPGARLNRIVERIRNVLKENGCIPIEAEPEPGLFNVTHIQVSSKMWVSKAGIVLVAGGEGDAFSMNLVHEAGFLQGQGKDVLILVEEGFGEEMIKWSNAFGVVAPHFPNNDSAFDPDTPNSIDKQLIRWVAYLKRKIE